MLKSTRPLTPTEKKKANQYVLLVIPVFLILAFILVVLFQVQSLPLPAKYGGIAIATITTLIFSSSFFLVKKDVAKGQVLIVEGNLDRKIKLSGSKSSNSGISVSRSSGGTSSTSYYLIIEGERYGVKGKHYKNLTEGKIITLSLLPKSQFILEASQNN